MRIAQSPQDEKVIETATTYMSKLGIELPRNHSFVIWKRNGKEFSVTVADVEEFCAGRKSQSATFRMIERSGQVEVLYMEAQI